MDSSVLETAALGFPWVTSDPFLFCVHHEDAYPEGNERMGPQASLEGRRLGMDFEGKDGWRMYHGEVVPGFPQHPHRGFETVTIARRGYILLLNFAGKHFVLRVNGDSMIEDGIFDGDYVVVRPNPSPTNGAVVVALMEDGSATLKRFFKEKGGFRLQPANKDLVPIFVSSRANLNIQGVVVALFRRL